MEYLLNEEQKQVMQQINQFNEKKLEKEKIAKIGVDDLLKNKIQKNNSWGAIQNGKFMICETEE